MVVLNQYGVVNETQSRAFGVDMDYFNKEFRSESFWRVIDL